MQEHMNDVAAALKADLESAKRVTLERPRGEDGKLYASTSYIQRKLQWNYSHAAAVIEALESEGWCGPQDFKGRRPVIGS